ncbi:MAG: rRNA adenine N(6)-methyltransferase family protein [Acidimicrobiia bacterium]
MPGRPATRWGWHRLSDRWAERLVAGAEIRHGDLVIDVGAGTGTVTARLVARGARVIAIELHPRRAEYLRDRFRQSRVVVVQADATDLRLPRRPFRVVANPPFATTTSVLQRLLSSGSRLSTADLVVPRHVAERWGSTRAPGVARWNATFEVTIGARVPRTAFRPAATTECAVLRSVGDPRHPGGDGPLSTRQQLLRTCCRARSMPASSVNTGATCRDLQLRSSRPVLVECVDGNVGDAVHHHVANPPLVNQTEQLLGGNSEPPGRFSCAENVSAHGHLPRGLQNRVYD